MNVREECVAGVTVLEVAGRIDSNSAPLLHRQLAERMALPKHSLLLDLGRVEYISSAGFRVLLLAARLADQNGGRFVLCTVTGKVRQLFDLGGFLDIFAIATTREEGIAAAT